MYFDNIPIGLQQLDRWVCWKIEDRDGKYTKVPINPRTGGNAQANNPDTWGSFETALGWMQKAGLPGIGFVLNGDGLVGVDIDSCRDPETGALTDEARDIICALDSYTEISQSGRGVHILCRGRLPEGKRRKGSVEMYEIGRFFIMTGWTLDDGHTDIEERTEALARVHARYIADQPRQVKKVAAAPHVEVELGDDEIIEKAMNAKNGDLFASLMKGNWKGLYVSQSEADLALCNILAFWSGCDYTIIDRIFRRSGLYRNKWDEKHGEGGTYGQITIARAMEDRKETYSPGKKREASDVGFERAGKETDYTPRKEVLKRAKMRLAKYSAQKNEDENSIHVPGGIFIEDGVYKKIKYNKDSKEVVVLSNFILRPLKMIRLENSNILTVEIICATGKTYIRDIDIKHFTSLIPFKKALGELLVFNGKDAELEGIKALLLKEKFPEIEGIEHTGFLKRDGKWFFASTDRVIDENSKDIDNITVLASNGRTRILDSENANKQELSELADMLFKFNKPGIAGAIIGWTASLFIREKLWDAERIKHPHLLVIGEAGSGKSETIENIVMPILCMEGQPAAAGQITRFSAMKNAAASNFIPYIIGEYKPSKLADWILREISEVLRNSYDRQEGQRGTTEQVLISYPYRSPILLIGEGSPTQETAIKERSMQLYLSKRDSKQYTEGYLKLKQSRSLLEKLGRLLLEASLKIDDSKFVTWHKNYYNKLTDIYDERIRQGISVVCTGLSLVQRAFKDAGVSIKLDEALVETVNQLKLDIYEGQEPKSDAIHTLELFDQLADIDVLVDGVHYKKIRGTNELALCVPRIFAKAKEYCAKTRTELQQQKDFMSQIKRHECFVTDKRTVKLYDLAKTYIKPVSCLIININNLKANIETLVCEQEIEDKTTMMDNDDDYNPFIDYEQQRLM